MPFDDTASAMNPDDESSLDEIALNPNFRENEGALLRALLQATDYGILLSGLDRQDILANQRMGDLFSCAPREVVRSDPDAVRRKARARVQSPDAFEESLRQAYNNPMSTFQDELVLVDEPPRTLRRFTGPVLGQSGQPLGRLWTFLDITENKRLQAEVEAQLQARTRDFDSTRDILQAMNDVCRLASDHRTADDLLATIVIRLGTLAGLSRVAVLLRPNDGPFQCVASAADGWSESVMMPPGTERPLRLLINGVGLDYSGARDTCIRDGGLVCLMNSSDLSVMPLRGDCSPFGLLILSFAPGANGVIAGIYRAEQLEALADQVAQTLESHRLQSQLRETVNSLQTAQRRLVEVEKLHTAGALAASVAHDIRNILSTLQMEMELLPDSAEPLRQQLSRFSTLTHRLLAYARPSVLELCPTSVPFVIDRVMPLLRAQAEVHDVEIVLNLSGDTQLVAADENQLEHLFVNLCLNAIQAMAEKGGALTLTAYAEGEWLVITVRDTGPGIAEETLPRIFDPFFTTRATGFGLGLFSCKRIVEEHGGEIDVANTSCGGACFTVRLPASILQRVPISSDN